jgi:hypothetical protein
MLSTAWKVEPAAVERARSSFFEDTTRFPEGSVVLDHALVMRRIPVQWQSLDSVAATAAAA